ncbi:hypothetical protein ASE86_11240 [Sphingomonas sp. Leaf33]|uniref:DUF6760 family protein n=1 Tax=Sphingomonas sp. Leaf33 TaxID=1736215 RepID=UPI0006FB6A5F|nr:DUF6760 family protein [Sphingomonas sp. Leaf33]KQN26640.1 hypothetical protein ASE86_11240 [Sphingomonas sp. Leaf33]
MTPRAAPDHLYEEIAFIAYHFHWSYETLLALEHGERRRWCDEISRINARMNTDDQTTVLGG